MKKSAAILLLVILNLFSIEALSQNKELDSLLGLLQNRQSEDTVKVNLLNNIAINFFYTEIDKTLIYAERANTLSDKINFVKGNSQSQRIMGVYYWAKSEYKKSLTFHQRSLKLSKEIGDKKGIANCYNNIGLVLKTQGNFPKALEYYQNSVKINIELNNRVEASSAYNNIGMIYYIQQDYSRGLEYFQMSLKISEELDDQRGISSTYNNIGLIYNNQGFYNKALIYYQNSLKINKELSNKKEISNTYNNIGIIHLKQNNYSKAIFYFQEALKVNEEVGDRSIEILSFKSLGELYLLQNNLEEAYYYAKKAFILAEEIEYLTLIIESSELLSRICNAIGYYKEAYTYQVIYKSMNDSLNKAENIKKIATLEYQHKYEQDKQLAEQELQKINDLNAEELKRQKVIRNSLIVGFLLLIIIVFIVYRNFIQKQKANTILTEQKEEIQSQAEELDIRNGKLRDLNATKDKFFSIISHDLKNPFNTLLGMSNLLLDEDQDYNEQQRKEFLQHINDSSSKTYKLLENLLTWSNSQTGMINYVPEKIKLKPLIDELVLLFKESSEIKDIKIMLAVEKSSNVFGDRNMLDATLRNLISNAIKFTPKGGEISIKAEAYEKESLFTKIVIQDTGIGISKEKQAKLFNISEEVITKGTEDETGTGLGLILCKEFVEKQGGTIWIESEEGKGTSVYFTIPNKKIAAKKNKDTSQEKLV